MLTGSEPLPAVADDRKRLRSLDVEPLLKELVSKPLPVKLIGWLLEKSMGSVCSTFEVDLSPEELDFPEPEVVVVLVNPLDVVIEVSYVLVPVL